MHVSIKSPLLFASAEGILLHFEEGALQSQEPAVEALPACCADVQPPSPHAPLRLTSQQTSYQVVTFPRQPRLRVQQDLPTLPPPTQAKQERVA